MNWLSLLLPAALAAAPAADRRSEFLAPNGLRVILEPRYERPALRLHLLAGWEQADLPDFQAQVLRLRSFLGRCGAGDMSRLALDRRLADQGIRLTFQGTGDTFAWSVLADSQDQEDAFELLGHVVFRPALAEDLGAGGAALTAEACFRASLGFPQEGFAPGELGAEERYFLHRRLVRPEHSVLVIQGDLSLPQARQLVLLNFGTWSPSQRPAMGANPPSLTGDCPAPPEGAWAGSPAPGGDPKARAAHLAVAILLTRLFRDGREGVEFETFHPGGDAGPLLFGVRRGGNPAKRIRECLESICSRGFRDADLAYVRQAWEAERAALSLHPENKLAATARTALKGNPGLHLAGLRLEDLNAALRARLAPGALRWLANGTTSPR